MGDTCEQVEMQKNIGLFRKPMQTNDDMIY